MDSCSHFRPRDCILTELCVPRDNSFFLYSVKRDSTLPIFVCLDTIRQRCSDKLIVQYERVHNDP